MLQTIVFAYDGSTECRNALEEGIALATRFNATCHLLAVIPPPPALAMAAGPLSEGLMESENNSMNQVLEEGVARLRAAGLDATGAIRTWEEPNEAIVHFASEVSADLVIVGHRRCSAFARWWRGSSAHSLLDELPCSLFVSMPRSETRK